MLEAMDGWSGEFRSDLPFIVVRLTLRPTEDGGRRHSIHPGYRAHWRVHHPNGDCTHNDGPIDFAGADHLAPGQTGTVRVVPLSPEFWKDLEIGSHLEMWEGGVVRTATVTAIHLGSEE